MAFLNGFGAPVFGFSYAANSQAAIIFRHEKKSGQKGDFKSRPFDRVAVQKMSFPVI
ncbi:MAG: hypothetical protein WB630_25340 [Candidatus Acidiferrales bacterium]